MSFYILLNSRVGQNREEILCLTPAGSQIFRFQGARTAQVRVSFVRPRELLSFDPRHVTRSPPIGKRI